MLCGDSFFVPLWNFKLPFSVLLYYQIQIHGSILEELVAPPLRYIQFELENFTGQTGIAVEQDFYATIYLSNLAELAKKQSDELILKNNENKDLKYRYQTNTNVLVGSLKDKLVLMMLEKSDRKRHKIFKQIINTISKSVTPVREGRSYKRKRRKVMGKYNPNHKRCL